MNEFDAKYTGLKPDLVKRYRQANIERDERIAQLEAENAGLATIVGQLQLSLCQSAPLESAARQVVTLIRENKPVEAFAAILRLESALEQPQRETIPDKLAARELIAAAMEYRRVAKDHFVMEQKPELHWAGERLASALKGLQAVIDRKDEAAGPSAIEAAKDFIERARDHVNCSEANKTATFGVYYESMKRLYAAIKANDPHESARRELEAAAKRCETQSGGNSGGFDYAMQFVVEELSARAKSLEPNSTKLTQRPGIGKGDL